MGTKCKGCGHTRKSKETSPEGKCPKCGLAIHEEPINTSAQKLPAKTTAEVNIPIKKRGDKLLTSEFSYRTQELSNLQPHRRSATVDGLGHAASDLISIIFFCVSKTWSFFYLLGFKASVVFLLLILMVIAYIFGNPAPTERTYLEYKTEEQKRMERKFTNQQGAYGREVSKEDAEKFREAIESSGWQKKR